MLCQPWVASSVGIRSSCLARRQPVGAVKLTLVGPSEPFLTECVSPMTEKRYATFPFKKPRCSVFDELQNLSSEIQRTL